MDKQLQRLTLYFDQNCPLCMAEILFLQNRNRANLLEFMPIQSVEFECRGTGLSCERALERIYAQFEDGTLIEGVDVFAEAYRRANLRTLAWIYAHPRLRPVLNRFYNFFAQNRHRISKVVGPIALKLVKPVR